MLSETNRAAATLDAVEHVSGLPAVPTRDWCQRSAETLANVVGARGRRMVFAVGVGRSGEHLESLDAVGVHSTDPAVRTHVEQSLSRSTPIGRRPGGQAELSVVGASELARSDSWLRSPLMRVVASQGMIGLLLGFGLITSGDPGRLLWIFGAGEAATESLIGGEASFIMVVLLALLRRSRLALGADPAEPIEWISDRERETLEHIVRGLSVREIAEQTGRSAHTVHDHVKSLHRKLRANSRGELVARALGHLPIGAATARS